MDSTHAPSFRAELIASAITANARKVHVAHAVTCERCGCTRECDGDCATCQICGYTMEATMEMPEPRSFNGDEDADAYLARRTGPRRQPPARCPVCGEDVPDRPFFGDATCGKIECRDAMVRR